MASADQDIIGLYRRHAQAFTRSRKGNLMEKGWLDAFLALLPPAPTLLDLGCGFGAPIGAYLMAQGGDLTGVDSSPELIEVAKKNILDATWCASDMRGLNLGRTFDGILAWHSMFHLTPDDQRGVFAVFRRHAVAGTALMFTSGPRAGEATGTFEGEPLYHASLDGQEYRHLLDRHGFDMVRHMVEDPECGGATVWLAQFRGS